MDVDMKLLFPIEKLILTFVAACWLFGMSVSLGLSLFGQQQQQQKEEKTKRKSVMIISQQKDLTVTIIFCVFLPKGLCSDLH